ncbi:MAG: PGF-pre-PGF domain-containing protein [Candidatus Micrarchaeota archaeon]|nr:PGF-pre-PGF domain-containing protein [Candidatus Micrarchaeota archaeon]
MKKQLASLIFGAIFLLSISFVYAIDAPPGASWWGTVTIDGSSSTDGAVVEAFISGSKVASDVVGSDASGYYLLNVPCSDEDTVGIRVNGILSSESNVTCDLDNVSTELNLTASKASNGAACTYDDGCSSGNCVDGYCCNSACSGSCNRCNVSGSEGTCTNVNSLCSDSDSSCYCSGGSCVACDSGYSCSSHSCVASSSATTGGIEEEKKGNETEEKHIISMVKANEKTSIDIENEDILSITEITITTKEGTKDMTFVEVNVRKEDKPSVTSPTGENEHVYSYFDISVSIPDEVIDNTIIRFKVSSSWVAENGIDPATIAMYRYENSEWVKLETTMTGSDDGYYYFESVSPGFSVYVVKGETKKAPLETCTNGEKKCDGNSVVVCKDNAWNIQTECEDGCSDGECIKAPSQPPVQEKENEENAEGIEHTGTVQPEDNGTWNYVVLALLAIIIVGVIVVLASKKGKGLKRFK